jgi:hypothetical protein
MGLITGLLTLPLAPARGLGWVLDQVVTEAEAQLYDPRRILGELEQAEADLEAGMIDQQTYEQIEEDLLALLTRPHA